jgi:hypothetical protein
MAANDSGPESVPDISASLTLMRRLSQTLYDVLVVKQVVPVQTRLRSKHKG